MGKGTKVNWQERCVPDTESAYIPMEEYMKDSGKTISEIFKEGSYSRISLIMRVKFKMELLMEKGLLRSVQVKILETFIPDNSSKVGKKVQEST